MARNLRENQQLMKQIAELKSEIEEYTGAIGLADSDETREILEDHIRQLRSKLLMTEKTRKKVLRQFYGSVYGRKSA